jgi:sialic acid synthase SpsE/sugar phosphate isomerase/epimerase
MKEFPSTLRIGNCEVGPGHPAFVIAEIGINHNGDLDLARRLIDVAADAGCSAVKFQKRDLPSVYTRSVLEDLDSHEQGLQYLIPILKDFELTPDQLQLMREHADAAGIQFLCTPFDRVSAELLHQMSLPAYKVSSADLTNLELIETLAGFGKPLLLSTGMTVESELDCTVDFLRDQGSEIALLHCVSSYPVHARDSCLNRIRHLAEKYRCPVGYSGHDIGVALSIVAATLGASIIEKHITLDKSLRGPDHKVSLLPEELRQLVQSVRDCELAIGDSREQILQGELLNQMVFRKSVVAAKPIACGERIEREALAVKSPGTGLTPQRLHELVGTLAARDLAPDDLFFDTDLVPDAGEPLPAIDWGRYGFVARYHDFEPSAALRPDVMEFHLTYADTLLDLPREALERHRENLASTTLRVHCCEYVGDRLFDLCSIYPNVLQESIETLERVVAITKELSSWFNDEPPLIVVNCGAMTLKEELRTQEVDQEAFWKIIQGLDLGPIRIGAQNMPPTPWYFGGEWKGHYFIEPHQLVDFCKATGQAITLDLSHAQMASRYIGMPFGDYIAMLRPWVEHIHVSDAGGLSGEGMQIGAGDVDFAKLFEHYGDYRGTWVPEIWQGHVNQNAGARWALRQFAKLLNG